MAEIRPTHQILIFFIFAQLLALMVGKIMIDNAQEPVFKALSIAPEEAGSAFNVLYLIGSVILAAIFLIIILLLPIRDILIRLLEFFSSTVSTLIVFFVILFTLNIQSAELIALLLSLALYAAKSAFAPFRNIVAVVASAGVGALIGFSIDPLPTIVFVMLIAIYDVIAVWWTGHMVQFAKKFVSMQTTFTIGVQGTKEVETKRAGKTVIKREPLHLELGTGDLAIPAALIVSVYKIGSFLFPAASFIG